MREERREGIWRQQAQLRAQLDARLRGSTHTEAPRQHCTLNRSTTPSFSSFSRPSSCVQGQRHGEGDGEGEGEGEGEGVGGGLTDSPTPFLMQRWHN